MKYDFIQEGFENGEVSPRFQGRADSDIYKTAVKRMANCLPTQLGSFASRAGGRFAAQKAGGPVVHLPVQDGPYGDFMLELGTGNTRMLDRLGRVLPWQKQYNFYTKAAYWPNLDPNGEGMKSLPIANSPLWVDFLEQRFYLTNPVPTAGTPGIQTGTIPRNVGLPAGTDESFIFTFEVAGDDVSVVITSLTGGGLVTTTCHAGANSIVFTPTGNFNIKIQFATASAHKTANIAKLSLVKNAVPTDDAGGLTVPANLLGARHTSFWTTGLKARGYVRGGAVALTAGDTFTLAGQAFTFVAAGAGAALTDVELDVTGGTVNRLVAMQNLADAINRFFGPSYSTAAQYVATMDVAIPWQVNIEYQTVGSAGNAKTMAKVNANAGALALSGTTLLAGFDPQFYVVILGAAQLQCIRWDGTSIFDVNGTWTVHAPLPMRKLVGDTTQSQQPAVALAAHQERLWVTDAGGGVYASVVGFITAPIAAGVQAQIDFSVYGSPPKAADALQLQLQTPVGVVRWMNVLRGLILGTSRKELVFSMDVALAIDPTTGQTFDVLDHSSYGSAENLPALDAEDKIVFAAPGRQQLRSAGIRFEMYGGFKAVDIGKMGEHLLRGRVRSMCFLRAPVSRVVVAFDDGTAAIGTMDPKGEVLAWARLTLPAPLVGIFSVAALDTEFGTELWIGTDHGETLRFSTLDSDPLGKSYQATLTNAHVAFDTEYDDPPVLDGWVRAPVYVDTGNYYATGLPGAFVGQNVYLRFSSVLFGPVAVVADGAYGKVDFTAAVYPAGITNTWIDIPGSRRATEVFVGMAYAEHKVVTLPLEGGNPLGTSQAYVSRKPQLYLRLVNSYGPLVNGVRPEAAFGDSASWWLAKVTGDRRATELGAARADVVTIEMDSPLRMEISAIFGGVASNSA